MLLDHLAIAAETLEEGVEWAQSRLGVTFLAGGKHARYGTHNRLLGLDGGLYLEVIAVDPTADSDGPRWFGLDDFRGPPRVANWICEPADFEGFLVHGMQQVSMERDDLRWDMGVPADGSFPMGGGFPTVLRWHTDAPPGRSLAPSGCALLSLEVQHPQAVAIQTELTGVLSDPRITFSTSDDIALSATFNTPRGRVTL